MTSNSLVDKTVMVTGGARRIGATMVRVLHEAGAKVVIHYHRSQQAAEILAAELNAKRPESVALLQADFKDTSGLAALMDQAVARWGRLDALVNNASSFYPTPLGSITPMQWDDLIGSNLKAPLFLSQYAAPALKRSGGSIVNIVDIHVDRPLADHPVYCAAKGGLAALTRSLAIDLSPAVRVNGVSPGVILWIEESGVEQVDETLLQRVPLARRGDPCDIAQAVLYLIRDAHYVTGQIIAVDGGKTLHI